MSGAADAGEAGRQAEDEGDADRELTEDDERVDGADQAGVARERNPEVVRRVDDGLGVAAEPRAAGGELEEARGRERRAAGPHEELVEAGEEEAEPDVLPAGRRSHDLCCPRYPYTFQLAVRLPDLAGCGPIHVDEMNVEVLTVF